jgi:hypothetical protein
MNYEAEVPAADNSWDPILVGLNAAARDHRQSVAAAREKGVSCLPSFDPPLKQASMPAPSPTWPGYEMISSPRWCANAMHRGGTQQNGHYAAGRRYAVQSLGLRRLPLPQKLVVDSTRGALWF